MRYLTDSRIEAVLDDMYGYAAAGDYYQAAGAFVEDLEVCYDNGIAADQYNYDPETGRSAATGRCAGMRPCLPWRLQLPAAALRPGRCERVQYAG